MKAVRAFLYFIIGVLFSTWAVFSYAETIPATVYYLASTHTGSTPGEACSNSVAELPVNNTYACGAAYLSANSTQCNVPVKQGTGGVCNQTWYWPVVAHWQCPSTGGWTLNGTQCTRPDPSACTGKDQTPPSYAWVSYFKEQSPFGYRCLDGCKVAQSGPVSHPTMNPNGDTYVGGTHDFHALMKTQYFSEECTVGESGAIAPEPTVDPAKIPPPTIKEPKCAATEGVLTSSSGKVACVPQGTVEARTPVVKTEKKTETFADNSTRTTETVKTTDPATSVTHTGTTVTSTGGQSGTAGTSTSSGTESTNSSGTGTAADGEGDGACDPTKDFCGGPGTSGLYEKKSKTVASVVGDFKTGIMSSGIGSAMTGFFTVSTPGGSCPSWVVDVAFLNTTLNLSQYFCTATAISMMQLVGAVLMFVAAFVGFRWAIL